MKKLNTSFYLLNPKAEKSQVYISLYRNGQRLQFAAGFSFLTSACNKQRTKGKALVRKGSMFAMEYNALIREAGERLHLLELRHPSATLAELRGHYEVMAGLRASPDALALADNFREFIKVNQNRWSPAYCIIIEALRKHVEAWGADSLDAGSWASFSAYLSGDRRLGNNTANKYLKAFRALWKHCHSRGHAPAVPADARYLTEAEVFKIALTETELETLAVMDASGSPALERVRDLFVLECLTGQRYSDIHRVLDVVNHDGDAIVLCQQKTRKQVRIPLHPKLVRHLDLIATRYPEGLPKISNQKFNQTLKEVCRLAGFNRTHQWQVQRGNKVEVMRDYRYNLVTSHTGRRTFCTLALRAGIDAKVVMSVTGHATYKQFMEYVKIDDAEAGRQFADKF